MIVSLALLSSLLWGTADFLGGTATRRLPVTTVLAVSQCAAFVVLLPWVLAFGARPSTLLPGLIAGVLGAIGLGAFYLALATGTMGVVAPLAACGSLVPVLAGLLQGDDLVALQWAGMVAVVAGVVLATGPELSGGAAKRPLLLALLAAACFGGVMTLIAEGSQGSAGSVLVTMLALRTTQILAVAPLALKGGLGAGLRASLPLLILIGCVDVGANVAFAFASRGGYLSVVGVLGSLFPVVTVLLARRVHHERLAAIQAVGVVAALGGVVLLAV